MKWHIRTYHHQYQGFHGCFPIPPDCRQKTNTPKNAQNCVSCFETIGGIHVVWVPRHAIRSNRSCLECIYYSSFVRPYYYHTRKTWPKNRREQVDILMVRLHVSPNPTWPSLVFCEYFSDPITVRVMYGRRLGSDTILVGCCWMKKPMRLALLV